jgi:hypothetical protein
MAPMASTGWASGVTPEVSTARIFSTMSKKAVELRAHALTFFGLESEPCQMGEPVDVMRGQCHRVFTKQGVKA